MSFGGLYTSISGIYANKKALDTVSHNIANVNNPDFVRQSVVHGERSYARLGLQHEIGTGVDVQQIRQIRDEFLDLKLRRELSTFGYYRAKSEILEEMEYIFREIKTPDMLASGALQDIMDDFWAAWEELYKEPESLTIRGVLHERAVAFTTSVNHIYTQLDNMQQNLNKEILNKTREANNLLREIYDLNQNIKLHEAQGKHIKSNDLRDIRNGKLDRLVELLPVKYYENEESEIVITLDGRSLVNQDYFNPIKIEMDEKGHGEIYYSDTGDKVKIKSEGELFGYIEARDKDVVEYIERLSILVEEIGKKINEAHRKGIGLDGESGIDFFEFEEANVLATIKINPELGDYNKIAVSKSGARGDGEIIKDILELREERIYNKYDNENENLNIDEYYRDLITSLGLQREEARNISSSQTLLINQIEERRQEISNVSLDEEMANMLKYQHSYIANSRVINAIDEMIDQIVNRLGIVGR